MLALKYWLVMLFGAATVCLGTHPAPKSKDCSPALSTALSPTFPPEYYIEQGVKYFLTMQSDIPVRVQPAYSKLVIRWEWQPWLLLTGYKRYALVLTDALLKLNPTQYSLLDCRFFEVQPFCRCHVVFDYSGHPCPIYEEFTFNDKGEITFIEAWSDFESLLPMDPGEDGIWDEADYWAMNDAKRLSTKVPGLGTPSGRIQINSRCMREAAAADPELADMVDRLRQPVYYWFDELFANFNAVKNGCNPPHGDLYPYYVPK